MYNNVSSPNRLFSSWQKGLIYEKRNEFSEAKIYFKNATALSPFHVPSLQHLVRYIT